MLSLSRRMCHAGTPLAQPLCAAFLADAPYFWRAVGQCRDPEVTPWLPVLATNLLAALHKCHSNRGWQWIKRLKDLGLNIQQGPKARPQLQRQLAQLLLPIVDAGCASGAGTGGGEGALQLVQVQAAARVLWNMARCCKVRGAALTAGCIGG